MTTATPNLLANQFLVAKNTNPDYHVHISCLGLGFEVVADMPEETAYAIASDYEAQLPSSTGDLGLGNGAAFLTNTHATIQVLTHQIWRNSSPIEIPIVLQFDAHKDAFEEVYRPMRLLEALVMPTIGGANTGSALADAAINWIAGQSGLLWAPNSGSNIMSLSIGKMLRLSEVLLISCSNTYATRMAESGYPISGQCDVVFRTTKVLSRAEWLQATNAAFAPV